MKRSMKSDKGFITVSAAILLAVICLFDLVLADAASVISAKHFYDRRAAMALESLLASYDSILFSKYGLLGLDVSKYTETETDFIKYISEPFRSDVIAFSRLKRRDFELTMKTSLAEPEGLRDAIASQMKYKSVANGAVYIAQALGFLEDAGNLTGAAADVAEGEKILSEANAKLETLKQKVEGYFSGDTLCVNGYVNRKKLYLISSGKILLKSFTSDFFEDSVVLIREALEAFHADLALFRTLNTDAFNIVAELKKDAAEINKCVNKAESHMNSIKDEDTKNELKSKISKLKANAIVMSNDGLVDPLKNNVKELNARTSYITENIRMIDEIYTSDGEKILDNEGEIDLKKFADNILKAIDDSNIKCDLSVSTFYNSANENMLEFDSRNKDIKDLSIYSSDEYKIPDSVYSMLPSVRAECSGISFNILDSFNDLDDIKEQLSGFSANMGTDNALEGAVKKFLVCDYVSSYLSDYSDSNVSTVNNDFICEKEYVIGGDQDSSKNIKTVSNILLGIRFAFNFMHCYSDDSKHSLASEIGAAIAAALTRGIGAELFAILIMCGWSMAESYIDVLSLRKGEKVPVIKNSDNWKTSIDGFLSGLPSESGDEEPEDSFGFNYSQYLSLIILLMPEKTILYRIADVIEVNMTDYTGERYMLSGVFTAIGCKVKYVPKLISPLFITLGKENLEIEIEKTASY